MQEIVCFHFGNFFRNMATVNNFVTFINEENNSKANNSSIDITKELEIKNVSFKYPYADKYILKNIKLKICNQ